MIQYIFQSVTSLIEALMVCMCMENLSSRSIADSDLSSITASTSPHLPRSTAASSQQASTNAPPDISVGLFRQSSRRFADNIGSSTERPLVSPAFRRQRLATQAAINQIMQSVDFYIRTRKRFDSRSPLLYKIPLHTILSDRSLLAKFDKLVRDCPNVERSYPNLQSLIESRFGSEKLIITTTNQKSVVCVRYLTPMQLASTSRVFGYFSCGNRRCLKAWANNQSFTNQSQECGNCGFPCYPFRQQELEKMEKQPHDMRSCQFCQQLGHICLPDHYYPFRPT